MTPEGRVLGIDVGWSERREANGLCLLEWDREKIRWETLLVGNEELKKRWALRKLCGDKRVLAIAIDGPLRPGLKVEPTHRTAEAALSRGIFQKRGKPGSTASKAGRLLHAHATEWARLASEELNLQGLRLPLSVHPKAIFEAFPNLFLSILRDEPAFRSRLPRGKVVDRLFREPAIAFKLAELVESALPGRVGTAAFEAIGGHDRIAAACCAMTALAVASGKFAAVGATLDGFIALPPVRLWGAARSGAGAWAKPALDAILRQLALEGRRGRLLP